MEFKQPSLYHRVVLLNQQGLLFSVFSPFILALQSAPPYLCHLKETQTGGCYLTAILQEDPWIISVGPEARGRMFRWRKTARPKSIRLFRNCVCVCCTLINVCHGTQRKLEPENSVCVWAFTGKPVWGESGELVCLKPIPCQPTHFWNDENGSKYHKAYFSSFPGKASIFAEKCNIK